LRVIDRQRLRQLGLLLRLAPLGGERHEGAGVDPAAEDAILVKVRAIEPEHVLQPIANLVE